MSLSILLLAILLNLCDFNILILDLIESININTNYIITLIHQKNNNSLIYNEPDCNLDCESEINNIKYFYNNVSQFKDVYYMLPIKIEKIKNNECLILYINKTIINKTNMIKDKRIFTFEHNKNFMCYINDMSASLWPR